MLAALLFFYPAFHIQETSKSDAQFKRNFDFNISPKGSSPKVIVELSSFFKWFLLNVLKTSNGEFKNGILSIIGSLLAIEDVELLCHFYKDFNYINQPFSHSNLMIVEKIISQESSRELLDQNGGSFADVIQYRKCNGHIVLF